MDKKKRRIIMKKIITLIMVLLLIFSITLTGCGGGTEEVASAEWPAQFSEVPAFTASPIENLEVIDEDAISMEFQNVTEEQLGAYANELVDAGFTYEPMNGNTYTKVSEEGSLAVGWTIEDTRINLFLLSGPGEEAPGKVVVQWPTELDGITALQGYTPNEAYMNPEGLVTVDYSDVTDEAIDTYRKALIVDGFEPYDVGNNLDAYARVDAEGTSFLVVINPQNDVEGHLQISGIITPAEE
jgi:hypothetical protein